MASDARAVAAWRRDRGEAVEDEDEEEAAVDEHDRQTAARERAARCVEIKWKASRAIDATRGADGRERGGGSRPVVVAVDPSTSAAMGARRPRRAVAYPHRGPGVVRRGVHEEGAG